MGLEITKLDPPEASPATSVEMVEKLWLDESREHLVPDGHPDAAFLFCTPGKRIPRAEAVKYGLIKGEKPPADDAGDDSPPAASATRDVLEAYASSIGVDDPSSFKKKADLYAAIEAKKKELAAAAETSEEDEQA